jgi:hypothetical protein
MSPAQPEDDLMAAAESGPLSADDLAQYARTGWVARRRFFSPEETAEISQWTDQLVDMPEVAGRHMVYYEDSLAAPGKRVMQRIENFCPYHPGFDGLVRSGRLFAAVEQLLHAPAVLFKEKINFKKAGGDGFEPHQDQQAGWSSYAPLFLTALVSIDRATPQNGCLELPNAPRVSGMIGEEWSPLTPEQIAGQQLAPVPCQPGDVLFFDSNVPHASKANLTDSQRRILYLTYNRMDAGDHRSRYYAEKRAHFPPDVERTPGKVYKFKV